MNDDHAPYAEALAYLRSFADYERTPPAGASPTTFYLPRMAALLEAAGSPQRAFGSVIVAGTKGKGSTCAMLEAVLRAAGHRVGLWTSPHLHSYRERMQVDRRLISPPEFAALVDRLRPILETWGGEATGGPPTTYELAFALALLHFAAQRVDIAVLEVGLGGRLDSANVVTPLVSAISAISYDHTAVLGDTLAEIAYEKAGIIKPGVPAITVPQPKEAMAVIEQVAEEAGSQLFVAVDEVGGWRSERATSSSRNTDNEKGAHQQSSQASIFYLQSPIANLQLGLRGPFQRENAALAAGTALLLRGQGWDIGNAAIAAGLRNTHWPGRLELAAREPLVVVDGAHNGASAERLVEALRAEWSFERLVLVLGVLRDKDVAAIVTALAPTAAALVLTRPQSPRALGNLEELAALAARHSDAALHSAPSVAEALELARALASPRDLICVTGSLATVADARVALGLAENAEG
jgi:dihydrofolate synthase/folylpolyglutamate synthase